MKNVSQRKAPGAMSAIAFIVNPVNPKVGVIFTSPVFSAMKSPLFILYFCAQTPVRSLPMPRPAMLEGLKGVVKCNVSMAQITDSDVRRKSLGHGEGNSA